MVRIFLCLFSALFLFLSFPKCDFSFLSWFALVPLLLAIKNGSLKSALILSWISGTFFFLGVFSWVNYANGVTWLHFSIMGLYLGLYFLIFGLCLHIISKRGQLPFVIFVPPLFVAIEYLRAHAGFVAQPMNLLGYTQHQNLSLIQMASFTGVYGVSFVIVLANAAITDLIVYWVQHKRRIPTSSPSPLPSWGGEDKSEGVPRRSYNPLYGGLVVFCIVLFLWIIGSQILARESSGKPLSVAVVQGNIPPELKWKRQYREQIISKYESLSGEASKSRPQLIVWPEASTPGFVMNDRTLMKRMITMTRSFNTYMLVGSAEYPKFSKTRIQTNKSGNTALFFSPEGKVLGQYLKIYLIPFGEYLPYEGVIPWPEFIVSVSTNSHVAGTEATLFGIDGAKFGTLICSEILYPDLSRCMVKKGAGFLVNISNEGWFGKSAFSYQFLAVSVFRAAENRVNVVRSTNTGISSFIDPYGRITARLTNGGEDLFVEGTLTREIVLSAPGTFYTRHGDILAYGCIAFSLGLMIWSILKRKPEIPIPGRQGLPERL